MWLVRVSLILAWRRELQTSRSRKTTFLFGVGYWHKAHFGVGYWHRAHCPLNGPWPLVFVLVLFWFLVFFCFLQTRQEQARHLKPRSFIVKLSKHNPACDVVEKIWETKGSTQYTHLWWSQSHLNSGTINHTPELLGVAPRISEDLMTQTGSYYDHNDSCVDMLSGWT